MFFGLGKVSRIGTMGFPEAENKGGYMGEFLL
jgi:hypothetical protein